MMQGRKAFTFVELIVVLVILTILSTIGFVSYESYLSTGRDTKRVLQLKELHGALQVFARKNKLPFPDKAIKISTSGPGSEFLYQGNIQESIAQQISFPETVYDSELDMYPIYSISRSRKDFQIMSFLEEKSSLQASTPSAYAADYYVLHPHTLGTPLGILTDADTRQPIQYISSYSGSYNLATGTGTFMTYFSDTQVQAMDENNIYELLPNYSCKRIQEMGKSRGDGVYTISSSGSVSRQVYCDMRTDGGGWTFVAFTPSSSTMQNFFRHSIGSYQTSRKQYGTTDQGYAIPSNELFHTEMMISLGAAQPQQAHEKGKLFLLRYQKGSDFFTTGPLNGDTSATVLFKNGMYADYAPAETTGTTSQWSIGAPLNLAYRSGHGFTFNTVGNYPAWIYVR